MAYPVPILVIFWNRPSLLRPLLESLQLLQPQRLYLACDGPKAHDPRNIQLVNECRELVEQQITWPAQVQHRYAEHNQGCRAGVAAAISWFFEQEEEGIVLEDDILPDLSFFPYCQQLLEHYRHDNRIGVIAANNHQRRPPPDGSSYRFSIYSHCWGWASWRRAWACYDRDLQGWPAFRAAGWLEQLGGPAFARLWGQWLDQLAAGRIDTWDMIWQFSCWQQGWLTVIPAVELVENIGFGADATHTLDEHSPLGPRGSLPMPLRHPAVIQANRRLDGDTFRRLYRRSRRAELLRKGRKAARLLDWR